MKFDYEKEPSREILCIDCKSFYASVECTERNLNPLTTMLVVMSNADNAGGLVLAASPMAKKVLGISNVTRKNEIPDHKDLMIVPPRMRLYMKKNFEINEIYKSFVAPDDHHVYSVDESFLDVTASLSYFGVQSSYELAKIIQKEVREKTGIYTTIGIGDNPLLAKLALDNAAKHNCDFIAEWRYKDVPNTLWKIENITDFWGIGNRMKERLKKLGILTVKHLSEANPYSLKERLGVMGVQLYAHSWGIDRSFIGPTIQSAEKSVGNSQVLPRVYRDPRQLEIVLCEIVDQVATRLRREEKQTSLISLFLGYAAGYKDDRGKHYIAKQLSIPTTQNVKELRQYALLLFRQLYLDQDVRSLGVSFGKLTVGASQQLNLFEDSEKQIQEDTMQHVIDDIRSKYGFSSLIHATSLLEGATAVTRANLVGGHAGGMEGLT